MKIIIRNKNPSSNIVVDMSGFDVTPPTPTILVGKSTIVDTNLSVLEFRQIPDVATKLGAGDISFSAQGGVGGLN